MDKKEYVPYLHLSNFYPFQTYLLSLTLQATFILYFKLPTYLLLGRKVEEKVLVFSVIVLYIYLL